MRTAQRNIDAFARRYDREFPAAVKCVTTDRQALTAYLRFPAEHWRRIRYTNLFERTFGETRRGVKVIGRLLGEASCQSRVRAVLDRAPRGWRGLTDTSAVTRHLTELRHDLNNAADTIPDQPAKPPHPPRGMTTGACAPAAVTPTLGRHLTSTGAGAGLPRALVSPRTAEPGSRLFPMALAEGHVVSLASPTPRVGAGASQQGKPDNG